VLDGRGRVVDALPGLWSAPAFLRALADAEEPARADAPLDRLAAWHRERAARLAKEWSAARKRAGSDEAAWRSLADLELLESSPGPRSRPLVEEKWPSAREAGDLAPTKRAAESPPLDAWASLARTIAEDTARNRVGLHHRVHQRLAAAPAPVDEAAFTDWLYRDLFRMPLDDPFCGLVPPDAFAALP